MTDRNTTSWTRLGPGDGPPVPVPADRTSGTTQYRPPPDRPGPTASFTPPQAWDGPYATGPGTLPFRLLACKLRLPGGGDDVFYCRCCPWWRSGSSATP
jgi:hypothetical protein